MICVEQIQSLALAGLTYWLRLQVVTYITGRKRRSFNEEEESPNLLESKYLSLMESIASGSLPDHITKLEEGLPSVGCAPSLGFCLTKTMASQLTTPMEEEKEVGKNLYCDNHRDNGDILAIVIILTIVNRTWHFDCCRLVWVSSWGRACSNGPGVALFKKPGGQNLAKDICLPKLPDVSQDTIVVFYSTFYQVQWMGMSMWIS